MLKLTLIPLITFFAAACGGRSTASSSVKDDASNEPAPLAIGTDYQLAIPQGLELIGHNAPTTGGGVSSYRLRGAAPCAAATEEEVVLGLFGEEARTFCASWLGVDWEKSLTESHAARSHATLANPSADTERLVINSFDSRYPYRQGRSQFEALCASNRASIETIASTTSPLGAPDTKAAFRACYTQITGTDGEVRDLWIGSYLITTQDGALPSVECLRDPTCTGCDKVENSSLLEVTFVTATPYLSPTPLAGKTASMARAALAPLTLP